MGTSRSLRLLLVALLLGAADALVFVGFEDLVNHGTEWIWDDVFGTDTTRWLVVPLALVLSVVFGLVLRALREPRLIPPHTDLFSETGGEAPSTTLAAIGKIVVVGATGLLAGASLGPEAPLVATTAALGAWVTHRARLTDVGQLLVLASVGALLVAFFASIVPVVVPLLLIYRDKHRIALHEVLASLGAGAAAWGMLVAVKGHATGYGSIPSGSQHVRDVGIALGMGVLGAFVGGLLHWLIGRLAVVTAWIGARLPWVLMAALAGTVLGVLYLIGGQPVQFTGSAGTSLLVKTAGSYGTLAFLGMAVVKLLATSWSMASGYRGGLVFPTLFAGVALSLFAMGIATDLGGPGTTIGVIAGILVAVTSPVLALVILLALLPLKLFGLGFAGTLGAVAGRRVSERIVQRRRAR